MVKPLCFTIEIEKSDKRPWYEQSVVWQSLCHIQFTDTRLDELEMLIENKSARGDSDALRFNCRSYLEIIDENTENILDGAAIKIQNRMDKITIAAGIVVLVAVVVNAWPLFVTLLLFVAMLPANILASRRCDDIDNFLYSRSVDFEKRLDMLCASRSKRHV